MREKRKTKNRFGIFAFKWADCNKKTNKNYRKQQKSNQPMKGKIIMVDTSILIDFYRKTDKANSVWVDR